ncbi:hypothetical protein V498_00909 [Pseudogymnoascus sp. VKM F-4517 (FW-2822)]|nr:hypothetical protein V498_00909 [Pseudogymnoascus sp. VKM F-4517 (FW-2822)]
MTLFGWKTSRSSTHVIMVPISRSKTAKVSTAPVERLGCVDYDDEADADLGHDKEGLQEYLNALAVDLNCVDADDPEQKSAVCLLADRNMVQREYESSRSTSGMTFYPLAFHPAYESFTSPGPLRFLRDHVSAVMKDNMSFQNDGATTSTRTATSSSRSGTSRGSPSDAGDRDGRADAAR